MAKNFNADFYVACATVIPVLFLAVAVQGRAYESVLRASQASADARLGERWTRRIGPTVKSEFLYWCALATVSAGGVGESVALYVLYRGSELHWERVLVFAAALVLVAAAVAGPLLAWRRLGRGLSGWPVDTATDKLTGAGEDQATGDQSGSQ